ncbi:hypothetical protein EJ110_NYTH44899 [Nymphaea thermarum]|nr:hypothetical protein EJ110_NYTH44899 [Nymphaea thermarum]
MKAVLKGLGYWEYLDGSKRKPEDDDEDFETAFGKWDKKLESYITKVCPLWYKQSPNLWLKKQRISLLGGKSTEESVPGVTKTYDRKGDNGRFLNRRKDTNNVRCNYCKELGHMKFNCPVLKKKKEAYVASSSTRDKNHASRANILESINNSLLIVGAKFQSDSIAGPEPPISGEHLTTPSSSLSPSLSQCISPQGLGKLPGGIAREATKAQANH